MNDKKPVVPDPETPAFLNTWVLLVDISGFSDRVAQPEKRVSLALAYRTIVDVVLPKLSNVTAAQEHHGKKPDLPPPLKVSSEDILLKWRRSVRIFSDSIFVFFRDYELNNPAANSFKLENAAKEFSAALWKHKLPHRGAIGFGECHVDADRSIFLGQPIVEAHRWEQSQKWLGTSIAPSSLQAARDKRLSLSSKGFEREVVVPTQDGDVMTWAINPFVLKDAAGENLVADNEVLNGFLDCYEVAERRGVPSVLAKYVNTARFLLRCHLESSSLRKIAGESKPTKPVVTANE